MVVVLIRQDASFCEKLYATLKIDCNWREIDWQPLMPGPLFVFAFVVATVIGAGFHLIFGGNARRLALFLLAGWAGFALGQIAGQTFSVTVFVIGDLYIVTSVVGSLSMLIAALIFTSDRRSARRR